jgi:hypothetical protein
MTTATKKQAKFDDLIGDDHTAAGASYAALGSPTNFSAVGIVISSSYDNSVFLSSDGTNDHIFVPSNASIAFGFSANKQNVGKLELKKSTQFYIKQGPDGAPTEGDLYISVVYAG